MQPMPRPPFTVHKEAGVRFCGKSTAATKQQLKKKIIIYAASVVESCDSLCSFDWVVLPV